MNILVAGGFDTSKDKERERITAFCTELGKAVSRHGHVLLNGCRTELDKIIAEATYADVVEQGDPEPDMRVISYLLTGYEPTHNVGTIVKSTLKTWDIGSAELRIPEQVQQADAVIFLGGFDGTLRTANWARIARKPLLAFTAFGGAAEKIFAQEIADFDEKYAGRIERIEYEQLNSVKSDWEERAAAIVTLAEKLAVSRSVLVIMSYGKRDDLVDAYETFKSVTEDLGYTCERVTEENAGDRILPDILERIERAAFVIVDLTDLRPNVFYELGYADGLGKRVVITAKDGTDLPFDVKDMPTVYWRGQTQLRDDLRKRIMSVVKPAVSLG